MRPCQEPCQRRRDEAGQPVWENSRGAQPKTPGWVGWDQQAGPCDHSRREEATTSLSYGDECQDGGGRKAQPQSGQVTSRAGVQRGSQGAHPGKGRPAWPCAEKPGRWGPRGRKGESAGAPGEGAGGSEPMEVCSRGPKGRLQPSTVPTPPSPSAPCPLQLVYPSDFRLTDKEVGPSPPGSRCRPGASRSSLGFVCFRKAASATCPSLTPTQVGDPNLPAWAGW